MTTDDQARTLKPCPFCGSPDIDAEFSLSSDGSKNAGCMSCGAVGPDARGTLDHISAWDMRARPTWADERPTEEGLYHWRRDKTGASHIVSIFKDSFTGELGVMATGYLGSTPLVKWTGQWARIAMPEDQP